MTLRRPARQGSSVEEVELPLRHRATGRDLRGFIHRGAPAARRHARVRPARRPTTAACGSRSSAGSSAHSSRGSRRSSRSAWPTISSPDPSAVWPAHLRAGRTTGVLKLVGIPLVGLLATRSARGALLVGLAANALNQLDTKPGRALKAYALAALPLRAPLLPAVMLAPYDLREMAMLGDSGSNALGALLGLSSVERFTGRGQWLAIGALAASTSSASSPRSASDRTDAGAPRPRRRGAAGVSADQVRLRHRRRRLVARQGHHRRVARSAAEGARPEGRRPEVRPVPQRRPRHDEPVPARRGLRHRGRRRDRPRHRPLRALPRPEPLPEREPHPGRHLGPRAAQRAQGRLPRQDRPGDPAHHGRDQGPDPPLGRADRLPTS